MKGAEDLECLRARFWGPAGREDGCAEEGGGEEAVGFAVNIERGVGGGDGLEERDGCEVGLEGECGAGRRGELVAETLETACPQPVDDCSVSVDDACRAVGCPVDGVVAGECGVVRSGGMEVVGEDELCGLEICGGQAAAGNEGFEVAGGFGGVVGGHAGPPHVALAPGALVVGVVAVEVGCAEVRCGAGGGGIGGGGWRGPAPPEMGAGDVDKGGGGGRLALCGGRGGRAEVGAGRGGGEEGVPVGGAVGGGEVEEGDVPQVVHEGCVWGC